MNRRHRSSGSLGWAVLATSVIALVVSASGIAGAAKHATRPRGPRAGQVVKLGKGAKIPANLLPIVAHARNADRIGGQSAASLNPSCSPTTVDLGTWCLMAAPYPLTNDQVGKNNYFFATQACVAMGGYLPTAAQLIGAANRVKLDSTIHDSQLTATVQIDKTRGLKDQREMSATLVTTAAGSDAAGSEGVSVGSTGDPRQGEPNPTPFPANPQPETLQYVTVYDNGNAGGFAGSEPVSRPENFRCAFDKIPGAAQEGIAEMAATMRYPGRAAAVAAALSLLVGCGSTPKQPPPAAGSPQPGSTVVHGLGGTDAASFYQEIGNRLLGSGTTLNYQLVGGVRVTSVLRRSSVSFVAAQTPRPLGELPRVRDSAELAIPIAFGGVAVIYHLPGLARPLRLRGGVIAAIFEERIKRWNDRRIRHDNPGVTLPATTITVVHRSDPSTASDLFTTYLAASSHRWQRETGSGLSVNWPAGTAVPDDATMRQVIGSAPGAIGYTDQATALRNHLPSARLRTPTGEYVGPSLRATAAVGDQPLEPGDLSLPTIGTRVPGAYPIASEQYVLTLRDLCTAGRSQAEEQAVQHVLQYMLGPGQAVARQLLLAPLPGHLRRAARGAVRTMHCGDGTV